MCLVAQEAYRMSLLFSTPTVQYVAGLDTYVLQSGKKRSINRWTGGMNQYDEEAEMYRADYGVDIDEALEPSQSTFGGEVMVIHSNPTDFTDDKVKFTLPVPRQSK